MQQIINKGTNAGGANTNYYGKKFEEKTNNQERLINAGYTKHNILVKSKNTFNFYLIKTENENKTITFLLQNALKIYMKTKYNIVLFRCPNKTQTYVCVLY